MRLRQLKAAGTQNVCVPIRRLSSNLLIGFRTTIGLKCKDGVVLGMEKVLQSKLLKRGTNRRIMTVDLHIGIVREGGFILISYITALPCYLTLTLGCRWFGRGLSPIG